MNGFDANRAGTGTREWADESLNAGKGCAYGCRYCYACANTLRFKQITNRDEWRIELPATKPIKVKPMGGVIMFPTSHDITPLHLERSLRTLEIALSAGREVLITTKASMAIMQVLCDRLAAWKDQVMYRITIGTTNDDLARFWEPFAPSVSERIAALKYAFNKGWRTSVSCEPLLGGSVEAVNVVQQTMAYISDTIWIGKLNQPKTRCDMSDPAVVREVARIQKLQTDGEIYLMVDYLRECSKVRWKDSIKKVIEARNG